MVITELLPLRRKRRRSEEEEEEEEEDPSALLSSIRFNVVMFSCHRLKPSVTVQVKPQILTVLRYYRGTSI